MKCRVHSKYSDLHAYWVDWAALTPLWERNDFHPLDASTLKRAYHKLWFAEIGGERHFSIGAIDYDKHRQSIMFINGRNRTILLSMLVSRVPLAIEEEALKEPGIRKALLQRVGPTDILTLPDLPVLTLTELRGSPSER